MNCRLIEIDEALLLDKLPTDVPDLVAEVVAASKQMTKSGAAEKPWISYLAEVDDRVVGTCAFKGPPTGGKVVSIADGDTITVLDENKKQNKVRLNGIDAPEKKQAFGTKSKARLGELVAGKDVVVDWKEKDKYGRIVGQVHQGSLDVNLQMVKEGLAWHYKKYSKSEDLSRAEAEAKAGKKGLWADPNPVPPWEFRSGQKKKKL